MTTNTVNQEGPRKENQLLNPEEQAVLSQIATSEPPHSQRAQALLAINEGATQAEAGTQAGLTIGRVRYWLTKFRAKRTAIFPDELLIQEQQLVQPEDDLDASQEPLDVDETAGPADLAPVEQEGTPKAKKKKAKKKGKKVAKKKGKKDPKGRKSKKKAKKDKKPSKGKESNKKAKQDKKASKGKKSKKKTETKKDQAQKTKAKKGKSGKKKRK
jgi:hypothetical protein